MEQTLMRNKINDMGLWWGWCTNGIYHRGITHYLLLYSDCEYFFTTLSLLWILCFSHFDPLRTIYKIRLGWGIHNKWNSGGMVGVALHIWLHDRFHDFMWFCFSLFENVYIFSTFNLSCIVKKIKKIKLKIQKE